MTPQQFKDIRDKLGLSWQELADVLGLSKRQIMYIEAGHTYKIMRPTQIVMCALRDDILTIEQVRELK